eukprot:CAMPEP_0197877168 /NCGR_PEP_ID=MMETSP1439-20131203/5949_1 /TAXON_ID=66791 /ORGANISM="Gonyaulax spinifera, Strain CCMP409" /LENGTH=177 /DNA_ID=CAMNT_0043496497 /DNA_START=86 /DNA_END=616 /DNA_ORIENTATION=+
MLLVLLAILSPGHGYQGDDYVIFGFDFVNRGIRGRLKGAPVTLFTAMRKNSKLKDVLKYELVEKTNADKISEHESNDYTTENQSRWCEDDWCEDDSELYAKYMANMFFDSYHMSYHMSKTGTNLERPKEEDVPDPAPTGEQEGTAEEPDPATGEQEGTAEDVPDPGQIAGRGERNPD